MKTFNDLCAMIGITFFLALVAMSFGVMVYVVIDFYRHLKICRRIDTYILGKARK
jgi:hypothetical protein